MSKRAYRRIPASMLVKFINCDSMCYGIVTNISENGMCIRSGFCLPHDTEAMLFIPLKDKNLEVLAEVKWVEKTSSFYDTMGVALPAPPDTYSQIVENIKTADKLASISS